MTTDLFQQAAFELFGPVANTPSETFDYQNKIVTNPWIAASLMQKAVRRGETEWASIAALSLLTLDPNRLWRRLAVIAVEDIGIGDLNIVGQVVGAIACRKQLLGHIGSSGLVVVIVRALCKATKCRAADNLYSVIESCEIWRKARDELAEEDEGSLARLILSDEVVEIRAIATRYLLGTTWPDSMAFKKRKGSVSAFFDLLLDHGYPASLVAFCRENHSQTHVALCGFLPILHEIYLQERGGRKPEVRAQSLTSGAGGKAFPPWALDCFTREGKAALQRLSKSDNVLQGWLSLHIPPKSHMKAMCAALFRVEGGLVDLQLVWPTGDRLLQCSALEAFGLDRSLATELLGLVRDRLPNLDEERTNAPC